MIDMRHDSYVGRLRRIYCSCFWRLLHHHDAGTKDAERALCNDLFNHLCTPPLSSPSLLISSWRSVVQDPDTGKTRIKLPSGARKTVSNQCRAMVGIVAGGGRIDKPLLKAGNSYHKYKVSSAVLPATPSANCSRAPAASPPSVHSVRPPPAQPARAEGG